MSEKQRLLGTNERPQAGRAGGAAPGPRSSRSVLGRLFISLVASAAFLLYLYTPSFLQDAFSGLSSSSSATYASRARKILSETPLIDGHNDLLINARMRFGGHIYSKNFTGPFVDGTFPGDTDLARIKAGQYAGAFWSAFWLCQDDIFDFSDEAYAPVTRATLQQIDLYNRIAAQYPDHFPEKPTGSVKEVEQAFKHGRIVGPLIIEGLHQIGNSPALLRQYYSLGVRYATLNWNCHNKYSDAAVLTFVKNMSSIAAPPLHGGLSPAGRDLVREMNRLGMIVDLSHTSENTMRDVLIGEHAGAESIDGWKGSVAPPIFSHSSAYSICPHPRNVKDSVLKLVKQRGSIVMVNISPDFIACEAPGKDAPPGTLPSPVKKDATLAQVARHIMHIGDTIGYEHVGIGTDFSGISEWPVGLEDVSKVPDLVAELLKRGVTDEQASMVVGRNILRVWAEVEKVSQVLQAQGMTPLEDENMGVAPEVYEMA